MTRTHFQLELAMVVSVLIHLAGLALSVHRETVVRLANALRARQENAASLESPVQTITFVEVPEPARSATRREPPRTFVETSPRQVTGEEPKEAEMYSDKSTVAANPENPAGKTGETPFLDGNETRVMSTGNIPGPPGPPAAPTPALPSSALNVIPAPPPAFQPTPVPEPAAPAPPAPPPEPPAAPPKLVAEQGEKLAKEIKPSPPARPPAPKPPTTTLAPAATAMPPSTGGPAATPAPGAGTGGEIASAKARLNASGTMRSGVSAFNVKSSPFGAYDLKIVKAVQSRWYALIEKFGVYERAGEVTVYFQLLDDGTIANLEIKKNTVGEFLAGICQKAIADSAPFDPLPDTLRVLVGKDPRDVNFTFYY